MTNPVLVDSVVDDAVRANDVKDVGWYAEGLVALDVTGTLQGRLDEYGARVLGQVRPFGHGQCGSGLGSCVWSPQLHGGVLFTSDVNQGLVIHDVL